MKFVRKHVESFAELFKGHPACHGVHVPEKKVIEGKKAKGKSFSKHEGLTDDHYLRHLHGEESLGLFPLDPSGNVHCVIIDVDVYPLNPQKYLNILIRAALPLVGFRSKSGGLHLYLFFSEPTSAQKVMPYVNEIRQLLALPKDTEIFPKQTRLVGNSVGNWINLPYYNFKNTKRYAYDSKGNKLELDEAIELCMSSRVTLIQLQGLLKDMALGQAPPCLQTMYMGGGADKGERNSFLFNCAVYLKARFKEDFGKNLHELNKHLYDPIDYQRLDTTVIASHNKRDYAYKCKNSGLTPYCDKELCKKRKYGFKSGEVSNLSFEKLTQIKSSTPSYIWTVNGQEMHFYSEEMLMNQNKFRSLCLRHLYLVPNRMTDIAWTDKINSALENVVIEEVDIEDDMSSDSLWLSKVGEFLSRQQAVRPDQVTDGLSYYQSRTKLLHFKSAKLLEFLASNILFRDYTPAKHRKLLKDLGAKQGRLNFGGGAAARTWSLNIPMLHKQGLFMEVSVNNVDTEIFKPLKFTGEEKF